MSKFTFSLWFCLIWVYQYGQTDSLRAKTPARFGLRIGIDAYRLARSSWDKGYRGLELCADYRVGKSWYATAELGNENNQVFDDRLTYTTQGQYIRLGFDYNLYDNWLDMDNMTYLGIRLGVSRFNHQIDQYKIYYPNPYLGENNLVDGGFDFTDVHAEWLELVTGIKAEVLPRIYMGFSLRINYIINQKKPDGFENLYIPGFNRTYSGPFGVGFQYNISYLIPFTHQKPKQKSNNKPKVAAQ